MTQRFRLAMSRAPAAFRLHSPVTSTTHNSERVVWLASLKEQQIQSQQRHDALLRLLQETSRAVAQIPSQVEQQLQTVAALTADIGLTVARQILNAALDHGMGDPAAAVMRCLASTVEGADNPAIHIFLSPEDLSLLLNELDAHPDLRSSRATFAPDPTLSRGVVRVEAGAGRLHYDPREVLDRIAQEVKKEVSM